MEKDENSKLKKERDEYLDGWKRAKAELINYKKEEMQRLQEMARYGTTDLIGELITVLDNFDLGLQALEKNGEVDKGIYMIKAQIEDTLRKRGLKKIEVGVGDKFDPSHHEAVSSVESNETEGTITEIIKPGYLLHDRILRPARVKTSKGSK